MGSAHAGAILSGLTVGSDGLVSLSALTTYVKSLPGFAQCGEATAALSVLEKLKTDACGKVILKDVESKLNGWDHVTLSSALSKLASKLHSMSTEAKHKIGLEVKTKNKDDEDDDWGADEPHPPPALSENSGTWSDDAKDDGGNWDDDAGDWDADDEKANETVDWGDEGDENEHVTEVTTSVKPTKRGPEKVVVGKFQILDDKCITSEIKILCEDLMEELGVSKGQAIHILRSFKWSKDLAVNKWMDDGSRAKLKAGVTHPAKEAPSSSIVRCSAYSGAGVTPSISSELTSSLESGSSTASRHRKKRARSTNSTVTLNDKTTALIQSGMNMQKIIAKLRSKHKVGDIMRSYQQIQGSLAQQALRTEKRTVCEEKGGRVPAADATKLSCGHSRCDGCWKNALEAEVASGREALFMRCAASCGSDGKADTFCSERVPRELFEKYLGTKRTEERYDIWVRRSFVETRRDIQCCPRPGCDLALRKLKVSDLAKCKCGHSFCFKCLEAPHAPVPCAQYQDFRTRSAGEYQQRLWFQMNTMQCPRCSVRIEKNRACLHMTCKCGYEWCWACRKEWGQVSHTYYNCPNYRKIKEGGEIERLQTRAAWELRKFRWYERQMEVSDQDVDEAKKILERVNCDLTELPEKEKKDYNFLQDTLKEFIRAKQLMTKLYIIAFYFQGKPTVWTCTKCQGRFKHSISICPTCKLPQPKETKADEKTKTLFEFQQRMMVDVTTSMMRLLNGKEWAGWKCGRCGFENEQKAANCVNCNEPASRSTNRINIRAFLQEKKRIQKVCKTMTGFVDSLVDDIESGKYDAFILPEPDDSIQGWFCIKCNTMNSFNHLICKCSACQVHGELSCLRCQPRQ
ncbi:hypothetical protein AAMO2058_001715900 [Amorphochlora amoebiformis]